MQNYKPIVMENLLTFIIIILGVVTPLTIITFRILFKKSLTFKIGVIVAFLLDTISILSFINGAGGELKTMMWMGPLGTTIIIFGFVFIIKDLRKLDNLSKKIELIANGNISNKAEHELLNRKDSKVVIKITRKSI